MAARPLFRRFDVFTVQLHREEKAREAVRAIPYERLAQQDETLVTEITDGLKMELPTLLDAEIYQTDRQVKIDARGLPNRMILDRSRPVYVGGTEITIHVPFKGDPALFEVSPSTHDMNPPIGEIDAQKSELLLMYQTADANSPIKAQFERHSQRLSDIWNGCDQR